MCKVTATQIAADGQAVSTAILSIANAPEVDPTVAADLKTAATLLLNATSNWKTGDPLDDINTAATDIEAVLDVIPQTAPYAPFVAITVAALDILISNLSTQPAQSGSFIADAKMVANHVDTLPTNHWRGVAKISHHGDLRKGFEKAWNDAVEANPTLGFLPITV